MPLENIALPLTDKVSAIPNLPSTVSPLALTNRSSLYASDENVISLFPLLCKKILSSAVLTESSPSTVEAVVGTLPPTLLFFRNEMFNRIYIHN